MDPHTSDAMNVAGARATALRAAVRVEWFTVTWMVVEAAVSLGAGLLARSLLLTAFGVDTVIEFITGTILLWRLRVEARGDTTQQVEIAEHRAEWVTAIALALLCVYVLATAAADLFGAAQSEGSVIGILISLAAAIVMPWLAWTKRRLAQELGSEALRGDAASSMTCGYMAATVLIGVLLTTLFLWWWAEGLAALVFLAWLARETARGLRGSPQAAQFIGTRQDDRIMVSSRGARCRFGRVICQGNCAQGMLRGSCRSACRRDWVGRTVCAGPMPVPI